jgi:hypothetical protein
MPAKQKKTKPAKSSMVDKTKVKIEKKDEILGRRVVGMGFALVGFLLILGVIILNVLNNVEPRLDEDLNVPVLHGLEEFTNEDSILITGEVEEVEQVIIYVNDRMQTQSAEVVDGEFEFEYIFPDEGEYVFEAVSIEGFPFRKGSEKSEAVTTIVDWTAPSADIKIEYESEVVDGFVDIRGEAEPNIIFRLMSDDEEVYSVQTDDEGEFEIENIVLAEGVNEFRVELEDRAGNKNVLARRVEVTSLVEGDEDVLAQRDIPEASGDLSKALGMIFNNNLIFTFGILALVALVGSSGIVLYKIKNES